MKPIFDDLSTLYPFSRVVDLGCGNGLFTSYLKEKNDCRLIGIDGSRYGLAQAKQRGFDETILVEDLCRTPYPLPDAIGDLVICKDVFEHLMDPLAVAREAHRLLRTGGIFLAHVPNHFPLYYRLKFLFTNDLDTQNYYPDSQEWDLPHIRFYSMAGFQKMIGPCGFKIVKDYSHHFAFVMPVLWRPPFGLKLTKLLGGWSPTTFSTGFTVAFQKIG